MTTKKQLIINTFLQNPLMTAKEVAKLEGINCTYQYIVRILDDAGIDFKARTERIEALKDQELKITLQYLYDKKIPLEEMKEAMNLSHTKIHSLAKEIGIQLIENRTRRADEQKKLILQMYEQGMSFKQISAELGISYNYALNIASRTRKELKNN